MTELLQVGPPPENDLDVATRAAAMGLVVPRVRSLVAKVHSRCPLKCDHCYVYESPQGGHDWRAMPSQMTFETAEAIGVRLGEEFAARDKWPDEFPIVIHGGEPELVSPEDMLEMIRIWRRYATTKTVLRLFFVTSGTRTTPEHLDMFRRGAVTVNFSLNGDKQTNDRSRRYPTSRRHPDGSSYHDAVAGIRALTSSPLHRDRFGGLIALMDLQADPTTTFKSLFQHGPRAMSFLFPHGNWLDLPPGLETPEQRAEAPYGKWLAEVYDLWRDDYRPLVYIELFESIMTLLRGGQSSTELIGGAGAGQLVIETNGVYESNDILAKVLPGSLGRMPLSVMRHTFEQAMEFAARQMHKIGATAVAPCAAACPVGEQCGGGLVAHRFSQTSEGEQRFDRSVFCADLMYIIQHIKKRESERASR